MKPGDVVEVEVDKLGILSNPIVDELRWFAPIGDMVAGAMWCGFACAAQ